MYPVSLTQVHAPLWVFYVRVRRGGAPGPGVRRTGPDEELALGSLRSRGTTVSPFNESKDGGPGMTNEPQIEVLRRKRLTKRCLRANSVVKPLRKISLVFQK